MLAIQQYYNISISRSTSWYCKPRPTFVEIIQNSSHPRKPTAGCAIPPPLRIRPTHKLVRNTSVHSRHSTDGAQAQQTAMTSKARTGGYLPFVLAVALPPSSSTAIASWRRYLSEQPSEPELGNFSLLFNRVSNLRKTIQYTHERNARAPPRDEREDREWWYMRLRYRSADDLWTQETQKFIAALKASGSKEVWLV